MKRRIVTGMLLGLLLGLAPVARAREEGKLTSPVESLVTLTTLSGWSLEWVGGYDERFIRRSARAYEFTTTHWAAQCGRSLSKWFQIRGSLGAAKAELENEEEGAYGFTWSAGARANVLEYVIDQSPVFGNMQVIRAMADLDYRNATSDVDGDDLDWTELRLSAAIVYAVDFHGPDHYPPFDLLGSAFRAGLVSSDLDADFGRRAYEEDLSFGWLVGLALQFDSGVTVDVEADLFAEDDFSVRFGAGYHF